MHEFADIVRPADFSLAEAFLAFARYEYPDLDPEPYLARLDMLAADAAPLVEGAATTEAKLEALGRALSARGFRGNQDEYADPRNSFLNQVLSRGLGIPISLSVIWIEVGRRCGLPLHGVGMPLHFLVGVDGEDVYADPFHAGRLVDRLDAAEILARISESRVPWHDEYLSPAPARDIVRRALTNLKGIYSVSGDLERTLWVLGLLCEVPGANPAELRDRSAVLAALGRTTDALADLRAYAQSAPDRAEDVRARMAELAASLN